MYQKLNNCMDQEIDFNVMVDSIIQISPAYNSEKNQEGQ